MHFSTQTVTPSCENHIHSQKKKKKMFPRLKHEIRSYFPIKNCYIIVRYIQHGSANTIFQELDRLKDFSELVREFHYNL